MNLAKTDHVAKELAAANILATNISTACTELNFKYVKGQLTAVQLSKELETLARHHASELSAILINLSYSVSREVRS